MSRVSPVVSEAWKKNNERMLQNLRKGNLERMPTQKISEQQRKKIAQDAMNSMRQNKKKQTVGQVLKKTFSKKKKK